MQIVKYLFSESGEVQVIDARTDKYLRIARGKECNFFKYIHKSIGLLTGWQPLVGFVRGDTIFDLLNTPGIESICKFFKKPDGSFVSKDRPISKGIHVSCNESAGQGDRFDSVVNSAWPESYLGECSNLYETYVENIEVNVTGSRYCVRFIMDETLRNNCVDLIDDEVCSVFCTSFSLGEQSLYAIPATIDHINSKTVELKNTCNLKEFLSTLRPIINMGFNLKVISKLNKKKLIDIVSDMHFPVQLRMDEVDIPDFGQSDFGFLTFR